MALFWRDAFAPTSLGTGVAKTTLNGGVDYTLTNKARAILSVTPNVVITAALTAAESLMIRSIIESTSIPTLVPKEWVSSFGLGGLGAFTYAKAPLLKAIEINTGLTPANTPITFSGQCQIANTVAPEMNFMLSLTDGGPQGPEQFYTAPTNETATSTAVGSTQGGDITINGGTVINAVYGVNTPGVTTASESWNSRSQLVSSNFNGVPSPQTWFNQPIAVGLGTTTSVTTEDKWEFVSLPIQNTFLGNTWFILDEAQTAAGNFIVGARFYKGLGVMR